MKPINVLSLFDWISCGIVALERVGIPVWKYFSSEVNKYAIQVSKNNWEYSSNIRYLWDVKKLKLENKEGINCFSSEDQIYYPFLWKIDLLIWGSPCQWFSFAWKQLNFEDPRSKLFFEYVRILKEARPKYFILENVRMKREYERIITQHLDWVEPILINSSLVSAQNRERLYWVWELQENGKYMTVNIPQPEDKKIFLKDILEDEVDEKYYLSDRIIEWFLNKKWPFWERFKISDTWEKGACLTTKNQWSVVTQTYILWNTHPSWKGQNGNVYSEESKKSPTLTTNKWEGVKIYQLPRGKNAWGFHSEKSPTLTSNQWEHNNLLFIPEATEEWYIEVQDWECFDFTHPTSSTRRGREMREKSNCMTAWKFDFLRYEKGRIRRLTPIECERLQTLPDNYTACVSNSQRYKQLGNWWTIDVITHILSHLKF